MVKKSNNSLYHLLYTVILISRAENTKKRRPSKEGRPFIFYLFSSATKAKTFFYIRKLRRIPAATAEPITPETLGAIACISKWLFGSLFSPSC